MSWTWREPLQSSAASRPATCKRQLAFGKQKLAKRRRQRAKGDGLELGAVARLDRAADMIAARAIGIDDAMGGKGEDRRGIAGAIGPRLFQKIEKIERCGAGGKGAVDRNHIAHPGFRHWAGEPFLQEGAEAAQICPLEREARRPWHGRRPSR